MLFVCLKKIYCTPFFKGAYDFHSGAFPFQFIPKNTKVLCTLYLSGLFSPPAYVQGTHTENRNSSPTNYKQNKPSKKAEWCLVNKI